MRYWIVTELFYPEEVSTGYVMTKIAEKINDSAQVGVICGPAGYQSDAFKANYHLSKDILIKRVYIPKLNKNKLGSRILAFLFLTAGMALKIFFNVRRRDKVILVTNPPPFLPMVAFLKCIKRFKLVVIVHDVFPENAAAGGLIKKDTRVYRLLLRLFNSSYAAADKLITVGSDMQELISQKVTKKIPMTVITNWADHEFIRPQMNQNFHGYYGPGMEKKIVVQFAGNIGRVQGLDSFFKILSEVKKNNFYTVLIGDGAQKEILKTAVESKQLSNVLFLPSKPRTEQPDFLNACHIGLVTLCRGMYGLGVPSKVYNILAAGKPVLYIGDQGSEISRYITEHNAGWAFDWSQHDEILTFLQQLDMDMLDEITTRGKNARALVDHSFTKEIILDAYKQEIFN